MNFHVIHRASRGRWIVFALGVLLSGAQAGAQRASHASEAAARQPVPPSTKWPSTAAIAITEGDSPMTVEATSDGWVVLTPIGVWAQPSTGMPSTRLQLAPSGVRRWTSAIRSALPIVRDTAAKGRTLPRLPQLGRGAAHINGGTPRLGTDRTMFLLQRCDGASSYLSLTKEDLPRFLDVLDEAVTVAERGSPRPIPPTLDRPYYASEVSCPSGPMVGNASPRFPVGIPTSMRRYTDVGVRFVVDTSGLVETRSIAVLPGAPLALERATRELVARWRFRPAVRGGAPVRQVMATSITYDPTKPDLPDKPPRVPGQFQVPGYGVNEPFGTVDLAEKRSYLATNDGWVQVRVGTWNRAGAFSGVQEWYSPDSVEAWAARALEYVTTDSARVRKPGSYSASRAVVLAHPMGNSYEVRFVTSLGRDTGWAPWTQMHACGGATYRGEILDRSAIDRFVAAAKAARAERATPREPGDSAFARGELACPAILPVVHAIQEELNVWRQPRGPIPPSMESLDARAEVLTSFVVDSSGAPKPSTLVAMPGSDPRAVAALRAQLGSYRFQPAMRSGVPVSALVIHNWSFEPRPHCKDTYDGLDCPRVYSKTSARSPGERLQTR